VTEDEMYAKLQAIDSALLDFQSYAHKRFEGGRTPAERDHCFGFVCGKAVIAAITAREAVTQLRVAMLQIKQTPEGS
jgi:hypothetical protein